MRRSLIAMMLFASFGSSQDGGIAPHSEVAKPGGAPRQDDKAAVRRLESITWNPATAELTWVVSMWDSAKGTNAPAAKEHYTIRLDKAIMQFNGQSRGFDSEEARRVRSLMDLISTYAVESTIWWEHGEGTKVEGQPAPIAPPGRQGTRDRDEQSKPEPKAPPVKVKGPVAGVVSQEQPGVAAGHAAQ